MSPYVSPFSGKTRVNAGILTEIANFSTKAINAKKPLKRTVQEALNCLSGGGTQIRTGGTWFCRPLPYHLAMPPSTKMERETGLEPATTTLARWSSTTELLSQYIGSGGRI